MKAKIIIEVKHTKRKSSYKINSVRKKIADRYFKINNNLIIAIFIKS